MNLDQSGVLLSILVIPIPIVLLSFLPDNQYNNDLMKLCVCAAEDHNCMLHLCTERPDKTEL